MLNSLSIDSKLNLTLDELTYVYNLEENNLKYGFLKYSYADLEKYANGLYNSLYDKRSLDKNLPRIIQIDHWRFNKTYHNNEFASGYIYDYNTYWETSNITHKIPTNDGIFIFTKSQNIYYLPFCTF